ncbi:MAG TPA: dihydrolipoyl dehydrogenase [Burkholderiaceae bacterium]|jgi:dihydrolipoamide dehydrogenase|nr:dihydrolipoyl dehydrogenase [Burkholderiaceae bacterium]
MAERVQIKVPDIGDFHDVQVIEILVKPGQAIKPEQSLITLESDKASMEIPSPMAGVVRELLVKLGDKVSEGSPILELEPVESAASAAATAAKAAAPAPAPAKAAGMPSVPPSVALAKEGALAEAAPQPAAATAPTDPSELQCEVLVLGSGPGGYAAAFRAADLGRRVLLVERYPTLGGVCLNVGCIPSKALLHVAAVIDEAAHFNALGVTFETPAIDLDKLRRHKDTVVGRLVGGVNSLAKMRKVTVVRGSGQFLDEHHLDVELTVGPGRAGSGEHQRVRFEQAIIAAGSEAVRLPFLPEDPRIVDSTGALELRSVPKSLLVVGGGIIGLEMATVYAALGSRIDVVEMTDGLMPGTDRDLVRVWQKYNEKRFARVMLNTRLVSVEARADALMSRFEGEQAPGEAQPHDAMLVSVGRTPNGRRIGAERAGVRVDERGFIPTDSQRRTNVAHIFAIGDIAGGPMLAHKATHEGHVAAEAASGQKSHFDALVIPSVAYTDPEIAWIGVTEDEARAAGRTLHKAVFPWTASGRAIANARAEGFTKLMFDPETHRIVGGGVVGAHAGDLISEIGLAIEMGADAVDIGRTIHPHPTLSESIGMAAEVAEGVCTDLPPPRR